MKNLISNVTRKKKDLLTLPGYFRSANDELRFLIKNSMRDKQKNAGCNDTFRAELLLT